MFEARLFTAFMLLNFDFVVKSILRRKTKNDMIQVKTPSVKVFDLT